MSQRFKFAGSFVITATVGFLLAFSSPVALAESASSGKAKVAMTGHPEKQHAAVTVVGNKKPMPLPKAEKVPKAPSESVAWVPGDYHWGGDEWAWDNGYWQDRPWADAVWIPGHWTQRWWGSSWVSGYWF